MCDFILYFNDYVLHLCVINDDDYVDMAGFLWEVRTAGQTTVGWSRIAIFTAFRDNDAQYNNIKRGLNTAKMLNNAVKSTECLK